MTLVQTKDEERQSLVGSPAVAAEEAPVGLWRNETPRQLFIPALAEFVALAILVAIGCGSVESERGRETNDLAVELSFATVIAALIFCFGDISGAHLNPAISFAFWATRSISFLRFAVYTAAQVLGALFGAVLVYWIVPPDDYTTWGATLLNVTPLRGFAIELISTYVLTLVVMLVCRHPRRPDAIKKQAPFAVFGALMCLQQFAAPLTGCSMNPARSLGPAVVSGLWANHWVYWIGPFAGSLLASGTYWLFSHFEN